MQYSDDLTDVPVANNLVEMREDPRLGCQFPRPKTSHPFGEDAGSSLVAHLKSRRTGKPQCGPVIWSHRDVFGRKIKGIGHSSIQ